MGISMYLYDYIVKNYKPNEPIFASDIILPNVSDNYLGVMLKQLCDEGKLKRYDTGIYYIPFESKLKRKYGIPAGMIAHYKYISRNGIIKGYYSGYTFANQLGITRQVPYVTEIVSNDSGDKCRTIEISGHKFILRKPRLSVNVDNYRILQFLDLVNDLERYADELNENSIEILRKYMKKSNITKGDIDKYIIFYPDKIYKNIYKIGLYDTFSP